ncbi:MAG: type II secretion system protein GspD [Lysobacterales bacterium CG02_land_8_20_14_3_00_62_12]|nr:MAG: type II secretion system protein GspD [Xanthomonadales bacterium CG02_land_8_20_14_3_00_62_12]
MNQNPTVMRSLTDALTALLRTLPGLLLLAAGCANSGGSREALASAEAPAATVAPAASEAAVAIPAPVAASGADPATPVAETKVVPDATAAAAVQADPAPATAAPVAASAALAQPSVVSTANLPAATSADAIQPSVVTDAVTVRSAAHVEPGTAKFLNEDAANRRPADSTAAGEVVFNFEAESLPAVVKAILGDLLQENYVIAPGLAGQVTFATAKPISADQAMGVLEMLLSWNNATLVYRDGRYTVLPVAQAVAGNLVPRTGPITTAKGYEVRAVPLKYISATAMQEVLTPYARAGAILKADNTRSMIVIAGTRADLGNYLQTIETFDVDWLAGMSVGVYPLERVEAATVVPELEKIFGEGGPTPLAGMFRFMPIERINAVLVITPQPEYLSQAESWLGRLDRGGSESGAQLFVYYVKNVKAVDLGDKLSEVFGSAGNAGARSPASVGRVAPGGSVEIKSINSQQGRKDAASEAKAESRASLQPSSSEGISISSSDDIRITSIEESNALMIRATPGQYESILGAIKRLDIVPLQVHIEAKILQVSLTGELSSGVRWFFENATGLTGSGTSAADFNAIRPNRGVWNSFAGSFTSTAGLAWTFLKNNQEVFISALQSAGNTKVLSAPSIVVLNNKTASLNSGTQIPVNSTSFQPIGGTTGGTTGGNNSFFNSTQFRDTGITLDVTPRVNPGGLVYMEIREEKSVPGAASSAVNGNVSVDKSTIETEVAVQSGETVVLAGLIEDTRTSSRSGVPGLVKIPLLGRLFGNNSNGSTRSEILVLITPTVIDSSESARNLTIEYQSRFKGIQPLLHPQPEPQKGKHKPTSKE